MRGSTNAIDLMPLIIRIALSNLLAIRTALSVLAAIRAATRPNETFSVGIASVVLPLGSTPMTGLEWV
jgi:hypothetical protein